MAARNFLDTGTNKNLRLFPPHVWNFSTHLGRDKNWRHFAYDIYKCIFLNRHVRIFLKNLLQMIKIYNIPALVQIMAWCRPDNKPLSGQMMISLLTHICVTRPQWVMKHSHMDIWTPFPRHWGSADDRNVVMSQTRTRLSCVSHDHWLRGDARSVLITTHRIDLVSAEYSDLTIETFCFVQFH